MKEKPKAMVLASFAADSLALGVHWIYNTHVIDKKFGRVEHFFKPERPTYHPTKNRMTPRRVASRYENYVGKFGFLHAVGHRTRTQRRCQTGDR